MKLCECGCGQPAPIAKINRSARGNVKGQPCRFVLNHDKRKRGFRIEDRGYETPCHIWEGKPNNQGYGQTWKNGYRRGAHCVAWEEAHGPIPDGLHVLHRCDQPPCIREDHLFLGTHADNMTDKVAKGRQARGERIGTKLTDEQVAEIRAATGTQREIAERYGVSRGHVSNLRARRRR